MMAYHGIPLVVYNHIFKKILQKEILKDTAFIDKPITYSIQQNKFYLLESLSGIKANCDDPIVYKYDINNISKHIDWYTRDELNDICCEDIKRGASWMYEI